MNRFFENFKITLPGVMNTIFQCFNWKSRQGVRRAFMSFIMKHNYLENGSYRIDYNAKPCLYLKEYKEKIQDSIGRSIKNNIFEKDIIVLKEQDKEFHGQLVIMTMNGTFKCFDFISERVMTIQPSNRNDYIISNIKLLNRYFNNTFLGLVNGYILEKRIQTANIRLLDCETQLRVLQQIINDQVMLITDTNTDRTLNSSEQIESVFKNLNPRLISLVNFCSEKSVDYTDMSAIWMHCDIHFGNVLLEQKTNKLYYIDFEYCREEIVIYDIINCAFVEYVDCDNSLLIDYLLHSDEAIVTFKKIVPDFAEEDVDKLIYRFLISRICFDIGNAQKRFAENDLPAYYCFIHNRYCRFIEHVEKTAGRKRD